MASLLCGRRPVLAEPPAPPIDRKWDFEPSTPRDQRAGSRSMDRSYQNVISFVGPSWHSIVSLNL
jgi:hypothetical protein